MRVPEIWYDRIDVRRFLKAMDSPSKSGSASEKSVPEFLLAAIDAQRVQFHDLALCPVVLCHDSGSQHRAHLSPGKV
jgi:hypothetical protein